MNRMKLTPYALACVEDKIYFVDGKSRFLFCIEKNKSVAKVCKKIYDRDERYGYICLRNAGEKLFLIPEKSDSLIIFDYRNFELTNVKIDCNYFIGDSKYSKPGLFQTFLLSDKIVAIPLLFKYFVSINLKDSIIRYSNTPELPKGLDSALIYGSGVNISDRIFLPIYGSNLVIELNTVDFSINYRFIENYDVKISALGIKNDGLIAVDINGGLLYTISINDWTVVQKRIVLPLEFKQDSKDSLNPQVFNGIVVFENALWLIPYFFANCILRYNTVLEKIDKVVEFDECEIYSYFVDASHLYVCTSKGTIDIDMYSGTFKLMEIVIEKDRIVDYIDDISENDEFILETKIGVSQYIFYVLNR